MQISDKLGQYNRNLSNGTEELRGAQGVQKLVSTVGDLSAGSVFEGTVNTVKGGKVVLALGNGQTIVARLEGKVDIKPGTAMFFMVKSNEGGTVSIRPYSSAGNTGNPILMNALTTAQVPVTERTLSMVDAMMQEQMSVDKQSILNMIKVLNASPNANVQTIVQMTKLGMPVTDMMASQFEQYLSDQHMLLQGMELAVNQVADALADENVTPEQSFQLYSQVVDVLTEGMTYQTGQVTQSNQISNPTLFSVLTEEQLETFGKLLTSNPILVENSNLFTVENADELFVDNMIEDASVDANANVQNEADENANVVRATLNKNLPVGEFLRTLQQTLGKQGELGFDMAKRIFARKEFQVLLRSGVEEQWLIRPQELKDEKRIAKLYEKMERQIGQLEAAIKATGMEQNPFLQTASDIRGNIQFMNQMNQIYNYVQMPLKLSGQNANGELYVYTNKKNLNDPEAEVTAFLHLDMENLGGTDVTVRMKDKKVKTNFYFDDDASYKLVEMHLPILEKRLKNKGYDCSISITNEKRNINFKENFVRKGNTTVAGSVHRYSFDVRA